MSRQMASSSGDGTMISGPRSEARGATGKASVPFVTNNNAFLASGADIDTLNANMGTCIAGNGDFQSIQVLGKQLSQLNIMSSSPELQIKNESLIEPQDVNFWSPQLNHEQEDKLQIISQPAIIPYCQNQQWPNPLQPRQMHDMDIQHFVMLRDAMREKIFQYIGRKKKTAEWRRRLPKLARRLEEILFRKFPNKNEYYNMMKEPIEPQLVFAIKTFHALMLPR